MTDLEKEIQRIRAQNEARQKTTAAKKAESRIGRMEKDITLLHRFLIQVVIAFTWFVENVGKPLYRAVSWPVRKAILGYRALWSLAVYRREENGTLRFGKRRAGLFLTATIAAFYVLVPVLDFFLDGILFVATGRTETVYLNHPQEIDPDNDVHSVQGCEALPCDENNSVYFRVRPTAFNHVWSLAANQNVFYPDYVAAAIPPGVNICTATSYGLRLKMMMRGLDIYPDLLSASCRPVTENN